MPQAAQIGLGTAVTLAVESGRLIIADALATVVIKIVNVWQADLLPGADEGLGQRVAIAIFTHLERPLGTVQRIG